MASGVCYIQVTPVLDEYSSSKVKKIKSLKVTGLTQNPPSSPEPGARVIKLSLEIPDEQLLPLDLRAVPEDVRMNEGMAAIAANLGKV